MITIPLLILMSSAVGCLSKNLKKRPHIIFILADDLGWNDVSFHGMTQMQTPNIDALATDGVILNNYYTSPICTPSRASFLTGMYPSHLGLQNYVIPNTSPYGLPLDIETLPEKLSKLGYTNHMVGKWHLGFHKTEFTPTRRGFKSHYGFWTGNCNYFNHVSDSAWNRSAYVNLPDDVTDEIVELTGIDFRHNLNPIKESKNYLTFDFTERAISILRDHNGSEPLFLFLAHHAVHYGSGSSQRAPPGHEMEFAYIQDEERRQFAGVLRALDDGVGLLIQTLAETQLLDDAIVIFSSDNGADSISQSRNGGSNWPLRGQKFTTFEGGVRNVAFVWSKLFSTKERVWDGMMHIVDWFPTIYEAAGGNPKELCVDGASMWKAITENKCSPRKETLLLLDPLWNTGAIRVGDYKLLYGGYPYQKLNGWYGTPARNESGFFRDPLFTNLLYRTPQKPFTLEIDCGENNVKPENIPSDWLYLFNIRKDPCEIHNIAEQNPQVVRYLLERLKMFEETSAPLLNQPRDYLSNPQFYDGMWSSWLD